MTPKKEVSSRTMGCNRIVRLVFCCVNFALSG